jgi:hypothetical protein
MAEAIMHTYFLLKILAGEMINTHIKRQGKTSQISDYNSKQSLLPYLCKPICCVGYNKKENYNNKSNKFSFMLYSFTSLI